MLPVPRRRARRAGRVRDAAARGPAVVRGRVLRLAERPDEVRRVASDLGINSHELQKLSAHGPHSADLLQKMLLL